MGTLTRRRAIALGFGAAGSLYLGRRYAFASDATPTPMPYYRPIIDPANYVENIDNLYMPLVPGMVFTYTGTSDGEEQQNIVTVMHDTKLIVGVACTVVHDQVFAGEELLEDTFDWFAQDKLGRVWYFGEASTAYENGNANTEGSWETGVGGASPGIVMQVEPSVGDPYRQEYLPGVAEDMAQVIEIGGKIAVPFGTYSNTVTTKEWSLLEPDVVEHKTYAPGVGFVYSIAVSGENEEFKLVDLKSGA